MSATLLLGSQIQKSPWIPKSFEIICYLLFTKAQTKIQWEGKGRDACHPCSPITPLPLKAFPPILQSLRPIRRVCSQKYPKHIPGVPSASGESNPKVFRWGSMGFKETVNTLNSEFWVSKHSWNFLGKWAIILIQFPEMSVWHLSSPGSRCWRVQSAKSWWGVIPLKEN